MPRQFGAGEGRSTPTLSPPPRSAGERCVRCAAGEGRSTPTLSPPPRSAGETVVFVYHTVSSTVGRFPPSCTRYTRKSYGSSVARFYAALVTNRLCRCQAFCATLLSLCPTGTLAHGERCPCVLP